MCNECQGYGILDGPEGWVNGDWLCWRCAGTGQVNPETGMTDAYRTNDEE